MLQPILEQRHNKRTAEYPEAIPSIMVHLRKLIEAHPVPPDDASFQAEIRAHPPDPGNERIVHAETSETDLQAAATTQLTHSFDNPDFQTAYFVRRLCLFSEEKNRPGTMVLSGEFGVGDASCQGKARPMRGSRSVPPVSVPSES